MELHNDEVPADEVWVVVSENAWGSRYIEWFITPAAATARFREWVAWEERRYWKEETTISRWYVALPRQRMERADVDLFVEGFLLDNPPIRYRLDVKRFNVREEAG